MLDWHLLGGSLGCGQGVDPIVAFPGPRLLGCELSPEQCHPGVYAAAPQPSDGATEGVQEGKEEYSNAGKCWPFQVRKGLQCSKFSTPWLGLLKQLCSVRIKLSCLSGPLDNQR